jgi:hypothetical protein
MRLKVLKDSKQSLWLLIGSLIALAVILGYANYHFLVQNINYLDSDFMTLWVGGRALLEGSNPYNPETWTGLFERYGSTWIPNPRAPHPLWTLIAFVPLALLPLDFAMAAWQTLSQFMLGSSLLLIASNYGQRRISPAKFILVLVGGFAFRGTAVAILNGQIALLLLFIVTLFLFLMSREEYLWAGLVLSLLVLKPTPFVLFAPLLVIWLILRRFWRVIAGGALGISSLSLISWIMQPAWLINWLHVTEKTYVTYQTPTVWGLAYQISKIGWLWVGTALTILVTAGVGWLIVKKDNFDVTQVAAIGLASSLFIAPYAWAYEHALLLLPILTLCETITRPRLRLYSWLILTLGIPWGLFAIAVRRGVDTLSAILPMMVGGLIILFLVESEKEKAVTQTGVIRNKISRYIGSTRIPRTRNY